MLPTTVPEVPGKRRRRKITMRDVKDMAALMSKRIDEKGACMMLGFTPKQWYTWKWRNKNNEKYENELSLVREKKLNACIEAIDEAGDGCPEKGQKPDWRAKAFLVQQVLAPERYQQKVQEQPQQQITVQVLAPELARQIFGVAEPKALPVVDVKEIPPAV